MFFKRIKVGLPAPVAKAIWVKPIFHASSTVIVPPNRIPSNTLKFLRLSNSNCNTVKKFLSHLDVIPYSLTPPNPEIILSSNSFSITSLNDGKSDSLLRLYISKADSTFKPSAATTAKPSFNR